MLFTQNIDCLERVAGVPSDKIIEAHGSFAKQRCIECKEEYPDDKMKEHVFGGKVPHCDKDGCNGLVKPDIVFFGEPLPKAFDNNTFQVAMADLVLIVGTSLSVYPFAALPGMAQEGKPRVLFNMEQVGQLGSRSDDVIQLGDCDAGIRKFADELGWRDELEALWRETVGDAEADRQNSGREKDAVQDEVERLAAEVGAVAINDDDDKDNAKQEDTKQEVPSQDGPTNQEEQPKTENKVPEPAAAPTPSTKAADDNAKESPKTEQLKPENLEKIEAEAARTESLVTEPPKPQSFKEEASQICTSNGEPTEIPAASTEPVVKEEENKSKF